MAPTLILLIHFTQELLTKERKEKHYFTIVNITHSFTLHSIQTYYDFKEYNNKNSTLYIKNNSIITIQNNMQMVQIINLNNNFKVILYQPKQLPFK